MCENARILLVLREKRPCWPLTDTAGLGPIRLGLGSGFWVWAADSGCCPHAEPLRIRGEGALDEAAPAILRTATSLAACAASCAEPRSYASILLKSGGSYAVPGTPPSARMRTPCGPEKIRR